jgi:bacterial leucyl aminopeptidase
MFGFALYKRLLFVLITLQNVRCFPSLDTQVVFAPFPEAEHIAEDTIFAALKRHSDPVAALVSLHPDFAAELAQPRLLHVFGEQKPEWMTEGDKLRLRRRGRKFMDITDHQNFYEQQVDASWAGKARKFNCTRQSWLFIYALADLPNLMHQRLIKPLFPHVSTQRMHDVLRHMTSYYNRYYGGAIGEQSAEWLHDHIAKVNDSSLIPLCTEQDTD